MIDLCLCGHPRELHAGTFAHCLRCGKGKGTKFQCKPGACWRFTWNPDAEKDAHQQ